MEAKLPFNPLERSQEVEKIISQGGKRKYYRFRATGFYGGMATADALGCCFLCAYCWNLGRNLCPERTGHFYSAEDVARTILKIAHNKGFNQVRVSGAEPVLGPETFEHLLRILEIIEKQAPMTRFVLETNGFILGSDASWAKELIKFSNLMVRVSLKAVTAEKFTKITGARGDFFAYPLQALIHLKKAGAHFWPAIMGDFFVPEEILFLRKFLKQNQIRLGIEEEELLLYPLVEENLRKRGFFRQAKNFK